MATLARGWSVDELAAFSLLPPNCPLSVQAQSTGHRFAILSHLVEFAQTCPGILKLEGSRVLEIGCGQGDTTVVLAELVGEEGKVIGVDPGPLDYGSCSCYPIPTFF